MDQLSNMIYLASIWVIPIVVAITFHEAAHGFVARFLGDDTAWRLGRHAGSHHDALRTRIGNAAPLRVTCLPLPAALSASS